MPTAPLYRYHRFDSRDAFLSAAALVDPAVDAAGPVTSLGGHDVIEAGAVPGAPAGHHVCAAWRGGVPEAFEASVVARPPGGPAFAGMPEAEAAEPPPPPAPVPRLIRIRQFLAEGTVRGLFTPDEALAAARTGAVPAAIDAVFATFPPAMAFGARLDWAAMVDVERSNPLLGLVASQRDMTDADMDDFFRAAARR